MTVMLGALELRGLVERLAQSMWMPTAGQNRGRSHGRRTESRDGPPLHVDGFMNTMLDVQPRSTHRASARSSIPGDDGRDVEIRALRRSLADEFPDQRGQGSLGR